MKPAVTIRLLLIAALVAGAALVWLNHHRRGASSPRFEPTAATVRTNASAVIGTTRTQATPVVLAPETRPIVVPNGQTAFVDRVKAIRALNRELTAEECKAFYAYLLAPAHSPAGDRQNENWLRNVMLDKLVEQQVLPSGLADALVAIYRDPEQDVVMRDYAIQHITPMYDRASTEEKATLSQALWQATGETDSSIAGTALLTLNDLAQNNTEFEKDKIAEAALKLTGNKQCGDLSRITAVQICGRMGVTQAAPLVLELAQGAGSIPLRITAIAALGDLGDQSVETFLQGIAAGSDDRLKPAAESALKRLKKKLGT